MPAIRHSGVDTIVGLMLKKASTAIVANSFLTVDSTTGHLQPAVTASTNLAGIAKEVVATTDTDYATARNTFIDVPTPASLYEIDCNTTITQAMVGDTFDLASATVVDNSIAGTVKHVKLVAIGRNATFTSASNPSYGIFRVNPVVLFQTSAT